MFTAWFQRLGLTPKLKAGDKVALSLLADLWVLAGAAQADDKSVVGHLREKRE